MTHTYIDPQNSVFRFGIIEAEVQFYGDVHRADSTDIQDWTFRLDHPLHGLLDITPSMECLDAAMTDAGLADLFRALHCPRAAKARRQAGIPATGAG